MSRTRGHRKACSHRSCFACSRADTPKRILAKAPTVADGEVDRDHFDGDYADGRWDDDFEADADGKMHSAPLRAPLIEIVRLT